MRNLTINAERLWDTLMETARIGGTPKGGICRLTLTDLDRQVRDWQSAEQKLWLLPPWSSQTSPPSLTPLPQTSVLLQLALQSSPEVVLPSSQASTPALIAPSLCWVLTRTRSSA